MKHLNPTQQERLRTIIKAHSLVRAHELRAQGITAANISRAEANGLIIRVSRGLYQRAEIELDSNQSLAIVARQVPNAVICMISALAYHGLTDQMPRKVWIAIAHNAWASTLSYPPIQPVRFNPAFLRQGIEYHSIVGVRVPIYSIAKSLADVFRNPRLVDRSVALEALKAALAQKKATPSEIFEAARTGRALTAVKPYLEALTSNH